MTTPELHTPTEWQIITGITIYDPDGWRMDGKSFDIPIDQQEWERRMIFSTCRLPGKYFIHEKD